MSEPNTSSGPILQLLANGLNLWIRRQCDEVDDLNLVLNGSALQLLRGHLKGVQLEGRLVTFKACPFTAPRCKAVPFTSISNPASRADPATAGALPTEWFVTMRGNDLNRALLTERWRWLGDWLAEQLMGLSTLGNFAIDNDTLVLTAPVINEAEVVSKRFRLDAAGGTLRIRRMEGDCEVRLPMDPNIKIEEAHLKAGHLHLKGQAAVTP